MGAFTYPLSAISVGRRMAATLGSNLASATATRLRRIGVVHRSAASPRSRWRSSSDFASAARVTKTERHPRPRHRSPLGCFILAFGWFGFNPGSTLGGGQRQPAHQLGCRQHDARRHGRVVRATYYMWMRYGSLMRR
jgi:ammonia channel protein AmtB